MPDESAELLERWRGGDQDAASALFHRYAERLIALTRSRLSHKLARRFDPEDIVQSAYRSFFAGARDGRYDANRSGDIWRLLVSITIHKMQHQVERHTAGKRAVDRERSFGGSGTHGGIPPEALADEPSPSAAVVLADELEHVMRGLEPRCRRILELRLQGHTLDEIAADTKRSQRTVRRTLEEIKLELEAYYRKSIAS
jgi:RNA polymerase sigma factor (sigma-70 family)